MARIIGRALKRKSYFTVASYFHFFARIYLFRWKPTVITVTGSSGKTTLMHSFRAQLGAQAAYTDRANSTFGIPFHLLGLERKTYRAYEWLLFALLAPIRAFRTIRPERLYVTEADAERPGEGRMLAKLLRPHILVWLSLEEAHGIQYEPQATSDTPHALTDEEFLEKVKAAIAREFGYFLEETRSLAVLNRSNRYIEEESRRTKAEVLFVDTKDAVLLRVQRDSVDFQTSEGELSSPHLIPPDAGLSLLAVVKVLHYLRASVDSKFTALTLPPGRSSVFRGIKNTTLIDSSYNATMDGMRTMLTLFALYPAQGEKWLVLGDMVEQGKSESLEHAALTPLIEGTQPARVILVGPRLKKYTRPLIAQDPDAPAVAAYDFPGEAYEDVIRNMRGGETILFKGARYLEGIVEKVLLDPSDASKLCRRESVWVGKRKKWGI
ncbi:MAG: hypothetical protein JO026_02685 [Patescibacteria group bacterium]|nr:hypothetical protein [Patescibacteria group bacterium]